MKLIRLVMLYFHTKESEWIGKTWKINIGDVEVSSMKVAEAPEIKDKQRQLVSASIKLEKQPGTTPDKYLIVPEEERKKAEYAVEATANMLAIAERCQREISSPSPCIAFLPENNGEAEFLESLSGIFATNEAVPDARFKLELSEVLTRSLSDRLSGVALLAEALAHRNATGKYHELVRLYELAFLIPMVQLDKKFSQFLLGSDLGYTRDEVKQWVQFRHPATHADLRKTQELVFESDIIRYIPRMEQAAYDLLLNKANWASPDTDRRNVWKPDVATTSSKYDLRLTQGKGAELQFQAFDEFNSYPLDLSGVLSSLPKGFWSKRNS